MNLLEKAPLFYKNKFEEKKSTIDVGELLAELILHDPELQDYVDWLDKFEERIMNNYTSLDSV